MSCHNVCESSILESEAGDCKLSSVEATEQIIDYPQDCIVILCLKAIVVEDEEEKDKKEVKGEKEKEGEDVETQNGMWAANDAMFSFTSHITLEL